MAKPGFVAGYTGKFCNLPRIQEYRPSGHVLQGNVLIAVPYIFRSNRLLGLSAIRVEAYEVSFGKLVKNTLNNSAEKLFSNALLCTVGLDFVVQRTQHLNNALLLLQ